MENRAKNSWVTVEEFTDDDQELKDCTKVMGVPGGVVMRHYFNYYGDVSESMVFIPGVNVEDLV